MREARLTLHACDWRMLDCPDQIGRWDALAQWATEPNPFFESWYLLPSLRALDPEGSVTMLCLEVDGQLAGLMPVRRYPAYYGYPLPHFRNWVHDNCFCGQPLVAPGLEAHFWREVFAWCDRSAGSRLFLHLTQIPATGVLHNALKGLVEAHNRPASTVLEEERAMLSSHLCAEDYLTASLTPKKRKELRRQRRRLEEEGKVEFLHQQGDEGLAAWVEDFLSLEGAGWKGKAGSALTCDADNRALFAIALHGAAAYGRLERHSIQLDGRPIAMLANFISPPGAYSFKTAFDEDFARFSPGVLLQMDNLALLQNDAVRWTDSCAVQDHKMIDHFWRERRRIARHSIAIGGSVRKGIFRMLARRETGRPAQGLA